MSAVLALRRPSRQVKDTVVRVATYSATRLFALFVTVVVAVYLTVLVANMGGYVDVIKRGEIREGAMTRVQNDPKLTFLTPEDRARRVQEIVRLDQQRPGVNRLVLPRNLARLCEALPLQRGFTE